jgi:hypothetical protein
MRTVDTNVKAAALACLSEAVEQLLEEARAKAGSEEGLFAHAVLSRIKNNATALGVPLEAIGLAGLNLDEFLHKPRQLA